MEYKEVIIAILVLIAVVILLRFNPPQQQTLSEGEVVGIAENFITTNYPQSTVLSTNVTYHNATNGQYKITIRYKQMATEGCKISQCYWEGPASPYCRQESNLSLGSC